jgi:Protein of unknown function (DUF3102)
MKTYSSPQRHSIALAERGRAGDPDKESTSTRGADVAPRQTIVEPGSTADLAEHAAAIKALGRRVAADIVEIGRRLTEAKGIAGHGNWLPWLKREFGWTDDTALNFTRVYEMSKSRNFRDLNIGVSSLYLLAAPSTPQAARNEVVARAEAGETLSHKTVKATVAKHRSRPSPRPARPALISKPASPRRSKLPAAELNSLAWSEASMEERRRFVSAVGVRSIWEAMNEADKGALKALATPAEPSAFRATPAEPSAFPKRAAPGSLLKGARRP